MLVGKCQHGMIMSAFDETMTTNDFISESVLAFTLERVEKFQFGDCPTCSERIKKNIELVNQTRAFEF